MRQAVAKSQVNVKLVDSFAPRKRINRSIEFFASVHSYPIVTNSCQHTN